MKKSYLLVTACLMLALALSPMTALAETMYVDTSNGGAVNMREGPSTDDNVVTSVGYGEPVEVLEWLLGGPWVHVNYNGYYGYIMARYLSQNPPGPMPGPLPWPTMNPVPAPTVRPTARPNPNPKPSNNTLEKTLSDMFAAFHTVQYQAVVVPSTPTTYVNMRWAPSKSAPVRSQYWAGTILEVLTENGTWSEVRDPNTGFHGFLMTNFLSPAGEGAVGGSDS